MAKNVIAIRRCDECGFNYAPGSSRQRICYTCTPTKGWQARYRRYGITKPKFDQIMEEQGWACILCLVPFKGEDDTNICIDHCHLTGVVRGIPCRGCNMVLSRFEDPEYVARVKLYLEGGQTIEQEAQGIA